MNDLFGNIIDRAIERLRAFEPEEGYYLAYSGGKIANRNFESAEEYWQWWLSRDGKYGQNEMPLFFRD